MNNDTEPRDRIELTGLESFRLLSAFQALQMPEGFYGATHEQCEAIIADLTGKPVEGHPEGVHGGLEAFLAWHYGVAIGAGPLEPVN